MKHFDLNRVVWQEHGRDGSRYAILDGSKEDPLDGFSYLFELPAGCWDPPHKHSQTSRILVLRCELRLGLGTSFDKGAAARCPVGSLLVVPGGEVHYDGCEQTTLVLGIARGPWTTEYTTEPIDQSR